MMAQTKAFTEFHVLQQDIPGRHLLFFKKGFITMLLQDKVALITGSGSGMGKAQALKYAEEGEKVIAEDINLETVEDVINDINHSTYLTIVCNHFPFFAGQMLPL